MDVQTLFQRLEKKHAAILSTAVATVTLAWYIKRVIRKSKEFKNPGSKEIPTPKGEYFYLGHLPLFKKLPAVQVSEWHKELGPIFRIKMGVQHWVFIGDPEAAHDILMTQGSLTSGRPFVTYGTKHHGEGNRGVVFTDYSKLWKKTRNATHSVLSPKMVDSLHDIVSRETEYGVQLMLKDAMKTTEGINPLAYTRLTALNIILATVYGIPGAPDVHDPFYNRVLKNLEKNAELISIGSDISAYFPILSFLDVIFRKEAKMKRFVKEESRPLVSELVESARSSEYPSLIKELDKIKDSLGIDEQNILATSYELTVGGIETVSLAMAWAFAILCHHLEWQKKMVDEVDAFVKNQGRLPLFTERNMLPNLVAFIKETIRYRPSFLLGVPHRAMADVVYKDYIIPKDTTIICSSHTVNNDTEFFENPQQFKPERYMGDTRSLYASSNGNIKKRELFTFGWGRRICPGIYMAESEMFSWMTQLFSKCTIEPIVSSTGEKILPDIESYVDLGSIVSPVPYKIQVIKRESV